jgi:hypothetical protein
MADNGNSSNTAILAVFVIVVILALGFFFFRGVGGSKKVLEVNVPKISQGIENRGLAPGQ